MKASRLAVVTFCSALAIGATSGRARAMTLPDSGSQSCSSTSGCWKVTNTAVGYPGIVGEGKTGVLGSSSASNGIGVDGQSGFIGVLGEGSGNGTGVWGTASAGDGLYGVSSTGRGAVGTSGSGIGVEASSTSNDGIHATTYDPSRSGIFAQNLASGGGGWGIYAYATGTGQAVRGENTNSSGWAGYFNGKVYASAGYTSSDARLKKEIADSSYGLKDIDKLRAVTFKWRDEARGDGRQVGFIAQDLQKVIPELVEKDASTGMLAVNYPALVPVLVKALQEQERRIESLERRSGMMSSVLSLDHLSRVMLALVPFGLFVGVRRLRRRSRNEQRA
jgi:hypothetical protein